MSNASDPIAEAFASDPENTQAFENLEERYYLDGRWADLVALYRARLAAASIASDAVAGANLRFRMAQLLEERCLQIDEAIEAYWSVAQLDPKHRGALRQLRRIHCAREQFDVALQIVEIEVQIEMPSYERAILLAELGELWLAQIGDTEQAEAAFAKALTLDPQQQNALDGMARTLEATQRNVDAAEYWQRLVDVQRGPERARALLSLGRVVGGALDDADRAAECFRRALTDDPRCSEAVEALVAHAREREQWSLLADLAERSFDLAAGARRRTEIALEASRVQLEQIGNTQSARMWLARAAELSPQDAAVHAAAAEIERRAGNQEALLDALEKTIRCSDGVGDARMLIETAQLCSELGDDERALTHLRKAQRALPEDPGIADALAACLGTLGRHNEQLEALECRIALEPEDHRRAELWVEAARIAQQFLAEEDSAREAWTRAFEADPTRSDATSEVIRLHTKSEDWPALRHVLERACEYGPEAERPTLLCSLGELVLVRFEDVEAAARAFELALEIDPAIPRALEGMAQLAADSGDEESMLVAYAREAAVTTDRQRLATLVWELLRLHEARDQLEEALGWLLRLRDASPDDRACLEAVARLREGLGQRELLLESLEQLEAISSGEAQAAVRTRLAKLCGELGRSKDAIRWSEASLESDPNQREIVELLVDHYRVAQRHEDRARMQRRLADLLPEAERASCLAELAKLLEEQLGDLDGAITILWQLASGSGDDDSSASHLSTLLERAGRYEELAQQLFERRQRRDDDVAGAREIDLWRGRLLLDRLGRCDEAAEIFRALHGRHAGDDEVAQALEEALRAAHDTVGLAALLAERAKSVHDPAQRRRLQFERARLLEESLDRVEEAHASYAALADQDDEPAIAAQAEQRLERMLERNGDWAGLRARLELRLENASDEGAFALHERLAALNRDCLRDAQACIRHLEAAVALRPTHTQSWQSLALLYDAAGRSGDLRRVLEGELACPLDRDREIALRARCGVLCALELEDDRAACAHYERLRELDPTNPDACEFLIGHYEDRGEHERLVEILEARLAGARPAPGADAEETERARAQRTSLRLRIAALRANVLDDLAGAIDALAPARSEEGAQLFVAEPLADLLQRAGRTAEQVDLCRETCQNGLAPGELAIWQMRLGDALRDAGQQEDAVEAYRAVLALRPDHGDAKTALRALYRSLSRPQPLAELLQEQLDEVRAHSNDGPEARVPIHVELADLYAGPLAQPERALEQWRGVLALAPSHRVAHTRALGLAEQLDRTEEQLELIELGLNQQRTATERADLFERRGHLHARAPGRADEAIASYRAALELEPDRIDTRRALRSVYGEQGKWHAALDCLFAEARAASAEERASLLEQGARLAAQHCSLNASLPWLERLRALRPADPALIGRIADVHRRGGRPEALLRALHDQIACTQAAPERCKLHIERARILERDLGARSRALSALEAADAACPGDDTVLRDLERLREALGDLRGQVEALEARIETTPIGDRPALLLEASRLCTEGLFDPERARQHLERALREGAPDDSRRGELLAALADSLRSLGRDAAWARVAEERLLLLPADDRRADELREELARTCEERLGSPDTALRHWSALARASERRPDDFDAARRDAIEASLLHGLRRVRNPLALEKQLGIWTERHPEDAAAWLELARLRDEVLHAPARAAAAYRAAVEADSSCLATVRGLRDSSERLGNWSDVAAMLEREIQLRGEDEPECAPLLRRLGEVCHTRTGDASQAAAAYGRALQIDGRDLQTLRAFQQLRESSGEYAQAVLLYEKECAVLGDREPERRQQAWLRAAELARDHTGERERARAAFAAAAAAGPLPPAREREWAALLAECGDVARHIETLSAWCDRADSGAQVADHLELADRLDEAGRHNEARERTARATEIDGNALDAWAAVARRAHSAGDAFAAAEALERAAQLSFGRDACRRYVAAALSVETDAPGRALDWLRLAVESDEGATYAHAHRARLAEATGSWEEAEAAATRALDGPTEGDEEASTHMDDALWLEATLVGGRAARRREDNEQAAVFYGAAVRLDEGNAEALAGLGEVLFAGGDPPAAREVLEKLLELEAPNPKRAMHLGMVGEGLELAGRDEEALARFEEALECDPNDERAHSGLARIRQRRGDLDDSVSSLERWASATDDTTTRADALARAGRLERLAGRSDDAESHLRLALEEDPNRTDVWVELAELYLEMDRDDAALDTATGGLDHAGEHPADRARLARIRARVLEEEDPQGAALAYALAAESDPRDCAAALSEARLRRLAGDWREAADGLGRFLQRHPEPDSSELASVYEERGRLLAGPLEEVEDAVAAYERALALDPERREARAKLASLLALAPGRLRDSVEAHRELLQRDPTAAASLRSLVRIAQGANAEACVLSGLGILRALGIASPEERQLASTGLRFAMARTPELTDPLSEKLRLAVGEASEDLDVLASSAAASGPASAFVDAIDKAQGELCAPVLRRLDPNTLRDAVRALVALALDPRHPFADTATAARVDRALGRRTLRRVRKHLEGVSLKDVAALDMGVWSEELRALATAVALDRNGGDLRAAITALIASDRPEAMPSEEADLCPLVAAGPAARALLARVVTAWCERIAREI